MSKYNEFVKELNGLWDKKKDDFIVVRGYINPKEIVTDKHIIQLEGNQGGHDAEHLKGMEVTQNDYLSQAVHESNIPTVKREYKYNKRYTSTATMYGIPSALIDDIRQIYSKVFR